MQDPVDSEIEAVMEVGVDEVLRFSRSKILFSVLLCFVFLIKKKFLIHDASNFASFFYFL